jgi:hypothetical protein
MASLSEREHPEIEKLVNQLRVYRLSLEDANKDRKEAADCIVGLVDFVGLLVSRVEELQTQKCQCQEREEEMDMLFSEWNEEK